MSINILRKIGIPEADIKKHFKGKQIKVSKRGGYVRIKADGKSYFTKPSWEFYVERINAPAKFDKRSFRKKIVGDRQILIGCPKGKWNASKGACRVGTMAVSIARPLKVTREGLSDADEHIYTHESGISKERAQENMRRMIEKLESQDDALVAKYSKQDAIGLGSADIRKASTLKGKVKLKFNKLAREFRPPCGGG